MYKVIICDLKSSRNIKNREQVQIQLIDLINKCNEKFKDCIICDFKITCGDEWEGLLTVNSPTYKILDFFKKGLPDSIKFYAGVAIGNLSITNLSYDVNLLDGQVFIDARDDINRAKLNNITY